MIFVITTNFLSVVMPVLAGVAVLLNLASDLTGSKPVLRLTVALCQRTSNNCAQASLHVLDVQHNKNGGANNH